MERRFHSPYRHWLTGLLVELVTFAAFLVVTSLIALVAARLS